MNFVSILFSLKVLQHVTICTNSIRGNHLATVPRYNLPGPWPGITGCPKRRRIEGVPTSCNMSGEGKKLLILNISIKYSISFKFRIVSVLTLMNSSYKNKHSHILDTSQRFTGIKLLLFYVSKHFCRTVLNIPFFPLQRSDIPQP